ncbi:YihY/virulence factor BrkB family protein [Fluoribacter dumoffii]|uniref:YihY/virulence factor BrkB family protein n=1 Tax=Fluoribacter dumoffii TaxID=463 RepID=UPI002243FEF5|nr:YihY/virulence factor BrkB family protein [Fluoribacter dumoffii]MCW8385152.1 YihY/virulence factor BrkB family protein [Fluoribacter dumoffii]MCW8496550.1 YihY/virulence factor BrkB family protein [Fluoribacter dumoffii]
MPRAFYFLKKLYSNWQEDRIASLAASLAYYTLFSLPPALLIFLSISSNFLGEQAAKNQLIAQISELLGKNIALQVQEIIENANQPSTALVARIISIIILLFGASGAFSEIQAGLNIIWKVQAKPHRTWFSIFKNRFLSFGMVLVSAFLLLVFIVFSTLLSILHKHIYLHLGTDIIVLLFINYIFAFIMITLLSAMMFKYLPDIKLRWSNVWVGAVITSLLFSLGKTLIGFYLSHVHIGSVYGAAGSLIILLIWIYYSAQIFFIGAEITKIHSMEKGIKIVPKRNASPVKK